MSNELELFLFYKKPNRFYSEKKDALTPNTVDIIGNIDKIIDFLKNLYRINKSLKKSVLFVGLYL